MRAQLFQVEAGRAMLREWQKLYKNECKEFWQNSKPECEKQDLYQHSERILQVLAECLQELCPDRPVYYPVITGQGHRHGIGFL